ncbi:MAG: histidine kinase [Flavipsychrobacter sp.]|nr:histidine kinase [Flavipsychrobacter sp.]
MPSNNVYSLLRDSKGYTWLCTEKGVVKYNGYSFKRFDAGTGLPADDIWQLYADGSDRIWLYSFGYSFGYIKDNKYKALPFQSNDRLFIASYLAEQDGVFYFIAGHDPLFLVVVAGDVAKKFLLKDGSYALLGRNARVLSTQGNYTFNTVDSNGVLYSHRLEKGRKITRQVCVLPDTVSRYRARTGMSPDNKIFIFQFNGNEIELLDLDNCSKRLITLKGMGAYPDEKIYTIIPHYSKGNTDKRTSLFTDRFMYVLDTNLVCQQRVSLQDILPTAAQPAYKMHDNNGNDWYTTNGDGTWLNPALPALYNIDTSAQLPGGSVLLGTIGSNAYWADNRTSVVYEVTANKVTKRIALPRGIILKTISGNSDALYFGCIEGLFHYDQKTGKVREMDDVFTGHLVNDGETLAPVLKSASKSDIKKAIYNHIHNMYLQGDVLYTLAHDYIFRHAILGDTVYSAPLYFDRYEKVFADPSSDDVVFYNTKKIVSRNSKTGKEKVFQVSDAKMPGVNNFRQIVPDRFGNMLLLGDERIFLLDIEHRKLSRLEFFVNMRGAEMRVVNDLLVLAGDFGVAYARIKGKGKLGQLYVAPNYTMGKPRYNQIMNFGVTDDGYAMLSTNRGVFSFTLADLVQQARYCPAEDDLFTLIGSSPEEVRIRTGDTFRIRQGEHNMRFDAINYHGGGELGYTYRISGKSVESGSGEIFLEALEPGAYHPVAVQVRDDLYESPVYTIYVYRYPYWWQTSRWRTIFWISGILLFAGLIAVTILVTRYFVAKKNERRQMLTDLELRAIHSQINPHFIFNTLSTSLYFISKKRVDDAYVHVNKFSQLLRSYLKSSQDRYTLLEEEIKMLKNYIELQQVRFEQKFDYEVQVDNKLPARNIQLPSLLLQPLVENAINHGLFHRETGGGQLLLKFMQGKDSTELICIIDDNGVGRVAARRINEESATKESYGTRLTNQLLDVFRQYERMDIKLEYTDKVFPETGTTVTLTLKNIKYVA